MPLPLLLGYLGAKKLSKEASGAPTQETAQLDPGTQELMSVQRGQARKGLDETAAESMQGAEASGQTLQQQPQQLDQQATALGMANPADLSSVLSKRAQQKYSADVIKLGNKSKLEAGDVMNKRQQMAMGNLQAQSELHKQAYDNALANEKQKKANRAKALGAVLGIAGTAVGAYAGGGAGAKVGSSAGQGLGEAAVG
jgi:hypothetical protein